MPLSYSMHFWGLVEHSELSIGLILMFANLVMLHLDLLKLSKGDLGGLCYNA